MFKIAIVDDDFSFAAELEKRVIDHLNETEIDYSTETICNNELIGKTDWQEYDLVFLDVELGDQSGMKIASNLKDKVEKPLIVFVSSYIQYSPFGYGLAAGYLLKNNESFEINLRDILNKLIYRVYVDSINIEIRDNDRYDFIRLTDIVYFESYYGKTMIHLNNGDSVIIGKRLGEYEYELSAYGFIRVKRTYLVNVRFIKKMANYSLLLSNGELLNTSRAAFKKLQKEYLILKGKIEGRF